MFNGNTSDNGDYMNRKLLSQQQVAKRIGVSTTTIRNWREAKHLPFFRAPGSSRPFYFEDDIEAFIDKNTHSNKIISKPIKSQKTVVTLSSLKPSEDWRIE